jgi:type II secretory pathway pseudopilin PulG
MFNKKNSSSFNLNKKEVLGYRRCPRTFWKKVHQKMHFSSAGTFWKKVHQKMHFSSAGLFARKEVPAQGTVEYLIVIAIVIVIGLVVASLATGMFDQAQITRTSEQLRGNIGSGGISIIDSIANYEGIGLLNLKNTGSEVITLTKITTNEATNDYDLQWAQGNTELIQIENLCICGTGQTQKTCEFTFYFITRHGLEKTVTQTITVDCSANFEPIKPPVEPEEVIIFNNCFDPNKNPIPICTLEDLNKIRDPYLGQNFKLKGSIDASETITWNGGEGWEPIGTNSNRFQGHFDGGNYSINKLYINRTSGSYFGLFGVSQNAQINNLNLNDCNITGNSFTGGLLGSGLTTIISNINVSGTVKGSSLYLGGITSYLNTSSEINNSANSAIIINTGTSNYSGGIIGYFQNSSMNDVNNFGNITSRGMTGGIVGYGKNATITNAKNEGTIETDPTDAQVGGIIGRIERDTGTVTITNVSNYGNINSGEFVGGIIGSTSDVVSITNVLNTGIINGNGQRVGGIIGQLNTSAKLENVINLGNITNTSLYTGGIVGSNGTVEIIYAYNFGRVESTGDYLGGISGHSSQGYIEQSYNEGTIVGTDNDYTGGIIGLQTGSGTNSKIFNSYNVGSVEGNDYVGGIAGWINMSRTEKNYNVGSVEGNDYVGGIAGRNSGKIINSFTTGEIIGVINYGGVIGLNETGEWNYEMNGVYWDTFLTQQSNCYPDSNNGCNSTNNNISHYYDSANAPMSLWDFVNNWLERENNYPILKWQTQ